MKIGRKNFTVEYCNKYVYPESENFIQLPYNEKVIRRNTCKKETKKGNSHIAFFLKLLTYFQFFNDRSVTLNISVFQIIKQSTSLTYKF